MVKSRKILFAGLAFGVACMLVIEYLYVQHTSRVRLEYLEELLRNARQREEKAVVVRRVSKQMEEIAYQQKEISDRQREQAEQQAEENYRMKLRVEEEWKKAVVARQEALEAYQLADRQKALAEERQYQAEYAKRVADTLTYLTLGRSLGSLSITQHQTGNYEIASLLAYSAWSFVGRYQGDVFLPSVFNSLSLSAGQTFLWQHHKGGLASIVFSSAPMAGDAFYTVSRYGEVLLWEKSAQEGYDTRTLLSDQQYDFRSACIGPTGNLCVLSFDGSLLEFSKGHCRVLPLRGKNYTQMLSFDKELILLSATEGVVPVGKEQPLYAAAAGRDITCMGRADSCLLVGQSNGNVMRLSLQGEEKMPVENYYPSPVTAFGYCAHSGRLAIGYGDGTILLFYPRQRVFRRLVGHRSAITFLLFHENKLYSSGYDRTLRLWNLSADRPEPVVALESSSWLHTLALHPGKALLLAGDENGTLYQVPVSPDSMAAHIRENLPRNFTCEEWTYYIGNRIPYEFYTSKEHGL